MIRAQELRLGNWVYSPHSKMEWQVYPDDFRAIWDNPENYEGIPLTEEWLIKFGFVTEVYYRHQNMDQLGEDNKETVYHHSNLRNLYLDPTEGGFLLYSLDNEYYVKDYINDGYKIQYVHQVQNLYFSLTGEELQIKEA